MSKSTKTTTKGKTAAKPAKSGATKTKAKAPAKAKTKPAGAQEAAPATTAAPTNVERATSDAKALAKPAKTSKAKAKPGAKPKAMSCLDAAVSVLKGNNAPMRCKDMVAVMAGKGLWSTTAPTPHATLYSAILREITHKGSKARFVKTERGHFELTSIGNA